MRLNKRLISVFAVTATAASCSVMATSYQGFDEMGTGWGAPPPPLVQPEQNNSVSDEVDDRTVAEQLDAYYQLIQNTRLEFDRERAAAAALKKEELRVALARTESAITAKTAKTREDYKLRNKQQSVREDATKRVDKHTKAYAPIHVIAKRSKARWKANETCTFFCPTNFVEELANKMDIEYGLLSKRIAARKVLLIGRIPLQRTPRGSSDDALDQLNWAKRILKTAVGVRSYLPHVYDSYSPASKNPWKEQIRIWMKDMNAAVAAAQTGVRYAQADYDALNKYATGLEVKNLDAALEKYITQTKAKHEVDIRKAEAKYRATMKRLNAGVRAAEAAVKVIVKDVSEHPWVSSQESFDYLASCTKPKGLVVVFQGANQSDNLTYSQTGEYVGENTIDDRVAWLRAKCFDIVRPKSGVNMPDGTDVYRHYWMSKGQVVDGKFITNELDEITAFLTALELVSTSTRLPTYILYRDTVTQNEPYKSSVDRLLNEIHERGLVRLVDGHMVDGQVSDKL